MAQRLIAMQCSKRGLGHMALVFGLLAVGTLSLSVATDFWLFTTEALDMTAFMSSPSPNQLQAPSISPPTALTVHHDNDLPSYDYDDLNATDDADDIASDFDVKYLLPGDMDPIVVANMHSGLWRSCVVYDFEGSWPFTVP